MKSDREKDVLFQYKKNVLLSIRFLDFDVETLTWSKDDSSFF